MAGKHITPDLNKQIDENLKRVYEDALKEEIPDKFLELISQLGEKEKTQNGK